MRVTTVVEAAREVEGWSLDRCAEYVDDSIQAQGEQEAEYGMGAVSLGYDGSQAILMAEQGAFYRTCDDPFFKACKDRLARWHGPEPKPTWWGDNEEVPF